MRVQAHGRRRLEQLYRTITRPALVDERVQLNNAGQVKLKPASGVLGEPQTVQRRPARICWVRLLKRVSDIDMQRCPNCGVAQFKIVAAILERPAIGKILIYLGLAPQPPPKGRVREVGLHLAA